MIDDLAKLGYIGLCNFNGSFTRAFSNEDDFSLAYFGREHSIHPKKHTALGITPVRTTPIGRELARIAGGNANEEYRKSIVSDFRKAGWNVGEQ
ncbi:DUF2806 domain-containing protein [Fimbriiglobus ruber]|uniref:DUF2806 domain-containing protein n=1 Tax=Fimbriiglobus ruber TaxID=1908690 RepID=UPI00137B6728|nr:DUF2806 domain-containing protein [Fimbriiglobus ruber]